MQAIQPKITPFSEPQSLPQTQKGTKLIAIWEIVSHHPDGRKLVCRWIQI